MKAKDYFDLFLTAVTNGTLEDIFNDEAAQLLSEYMEFIFSNGDSKMKDFMRLNLLERCIDDKCSYKLWEGHSLDNICPETKDQVKEFFTKAIRLIETRSEDIYKNLKGELC